MKSGRRAQPWLPSQHAGMQRQRQADLLSSKQLGLKSEFQDGQDYYTKKPCLEKKKTRRRHHKIHSGKRGQKRDREWRDEAGIGTGKEGSGVERRKEK